ncbi:MAG: hypothetical protein OEW16_06620 [Gammaproteobacteria bacterium]|nr:hypothetical protein [Gammaproteobacteria bacterium]
MSVWTLVSYGCWALSILMVVWMIYDWIKIDGKYTEAQLTSSREGEIEAISEKHNI